MNHFSFVIYGGGPIYLRNVQITIWGNTYICSLCMPHANTWIKEEIGREDVAY